MAIDVRARCGGDLGVDSSVVLGNGRFGRFLERGDDGWAGDDVGVGDLGPECDSVVSRSVLLLYGFYGCIRDNCPVGTTGSSVTYHQYPQTFGLRR